MAAGGEAPVAGCCCQADRKDACYQFETQKVLCPRIAWSLDIVFECAISSIWPSFACSSSNSWRQDRCGFSLDMLNEIEENKEARDGKRLNGSGYNRLFAFSNYRYPGGSVRIQCFWELLSLIPPVFQ